MTVPKEKSGGGADWERFNRLAQEFQRESDRGCAVLVLCLLEEALLDLFRRFVTDPDSEALNNLAPRGRLKAAIDNAELLGLLGSRTAKSFRSLVAIRNKFAHGVMEGLSFDTPQIASLVKSAPSCMDDSLCPKEWQAFIARDQPREKFLVLANMLFIALQSPMVHRPRLSRGTDVPVVFDPFV